MELKAFVQYYLEQASVLTLALALGRNWQGHLCLWQLFRSFKQTCSLKVKHDSGQEVTNSDQQKFQASNHIPISSLNLSVRMIFNTLVTCHKSSSIKVLMLVFMFVKYEMKSEQGRPLRFPVRHLLHSMMWLVVFQYFNTVEKCCLLRPLQNRGNLIPGFLLKTARLVVAL